MNSCVSSKQNFDSPEMREKLTRYGMQESYTVYDILAITLKRLKGHERGSGVFVFKNQHNAKVFQGIFGGELKSNMVKVWEDENSGLAQ
jgi:hypothetical protein